MNVEQLISKLQNNGNNFEITLEDGSTIYLPDIIDVKPKSEYRFIAHKVNNLFSVNAEAMSLEKFINLIEKNHDKYIVSSSIRYEDMVEAKSTPIRNNGKWIYKQVLFQNPLSFTFIEFGDYIYIPESMDKIYSLISFMHNNRPITNLFSNSNNSLWWNTLDSEFKERLLEIPVTILNIRRNTSNSKEYLTKISCLFDIPQKVQYRYSTID